MVLPISVLLRAPPLLRLRSLRKFIRNRAYMAVGSVCNVDVLSIYHTGVKNAVKKVKVTHTRL